MLKMQNLDRGQPLQELPSIVLVADAHQAVVVKDEAEAVVIVPALDVVTAQHLAGIAKGEATLSAGHHGFHLAASNGVPHVVGDVSIARTRVGE